MRVPPTLHVVSPGAGPGAPVQGRESRPPSSVHWQKHKGSPGSLRSLSHLSLSHRGGAASLWPSFCFSSYSWPPPPVPSHPRALLSPAGALKVRGGGLASLSPPSLSPGALYFPGLGNPCRIENRPSGWGAEGVRGGSLGWAVWEMTQDAQNVIDPVG